jgi:pantoate--beta-alanine ligase
VVCKLFNIVRPHVAIFGEKDYQQLAVIRRMVADLDMPIEIVGLPTVREPDGLAMSSRNKYLSPEERQRARGLSRGLRLAWSLFDAGERNPVKLAAAAQSEIAPAANRIDYVELRDAATLAPIVERVTAPAVLAVAAFVGTTRLIDNQRLG